MINCLRKYGTHYSALVEFMDLVYLKSTLGLSEQEQFQLVIHQARMKCLAFCFTKSKA